MTPERSANIRQHVERDLERLITTFNKEKSVVKMKKTGAEKFEIILGLPLDDKFLDPKNPVDEINNVVYPNVRPSCIWFIEKIAISLGYEGITWNNNQTEGTLQK